jgi:hypothetical protein
MVRVEVGEEGNLNTVLACEWDDLGQRLSHKRLQRRRVLQEINYNRGLADNKLNSCPGKP